jgi:hypothetical protein
MALTRADLIASTKDIERVVRRCVTESDGSFSAVIPVSAPLASMARTATTAKEADLMVQSSGMPVFIKHLQQSIAQAQQFCAARDRLDDPEPLDVLPLTADMREPVEPPVKKKKSTPKPVAQGKISQTASGRVDALLQAVKNSTSNEQGLDTIRHHLSQLSKDKSLAVEHREVLKRVLMASEVGAMRVEKFLKQVDHEIQDFADGPWCDLRQ